MESRAADRGRGRSAAAGTDATRVPLPPPEPTLLLLLRLRRLRQEELGRRLQGMTGHQHQLLELQQLLDVLLSRRTEHKNDEPQTTVLLCSCPNHAPGVREENSLRGLRLVPQTAGLTGSQYLGGELDWLREG